MLDATAASGLLALRLAVAFDPVCEGVVFTEGFDAPWIRPSPNFARDRTANVW